MNEGSIRLCLIEYWDYIRYVYAAEAGLQPQAEFCLLCALSAVTVCGHLEVSGGVRL